MKPMFSRLTLTAAMIALSACSSTSQPGHSTSLGEDNLKGSGFLADIYPQMKEGSDGEALRLYRNPKFASSATFVPYTKVLLDPVKLYAGSSSKLNDAPQAQSNAIAQGFYNQLHEQLSKDYQMVDKAGPGTLQISVAVVDAQEADASLKAASYIPIPLGVPGAKAAAMQAASHTTGKPPFAGQVTIEGKMADAQTGEIIAAEIDRRVGARKPIIGLFESSTYDSWSDVTEAERYWAELLRYRLCMRRGATDCQKASE
ncbi:hypothetical protein D3C77_63300 [compost metagenome]|uniref:DUF3313 domain-containing protein n=1 Tax=Pseudomonas TaxID=286 RepID=UPI00041BF5BD|nr:MULTISPECIES: DUF3313 domain-containing protein [Pseudomonas]MCW2271499.1 hypothetical protein [Pseudomonas sp. JUb96]